MIVWHGSSKVTHVVKNYTSSCWFYYSCKKKTINPISLKTVSRGYETSAQSYLFRRRPLPSGNIPIQMQAIMLPAGGLDSGKLIVASSKSWGYPIHGTFFPSELS